MNVISGKRYYVGCFLLSVSLSVSAGISQFACDPDNFSLAKADANFSYGEGYEQYHFSFEYSGQYWNAVAALFYPLPNPNSMAEGLTEEMSGPAAIQTVYHNARRSLLDGAIADSVSKPSVVKLGSNDLVTFSAESVTGLLNFGLLVERLGADGVIVYRLHYLVDDGTSEIGSIDEMLQVMQALGRSCESDGV